MTFVNTDSKNLNINQQSAPVQSTTKHTNATVQNVPMVKKLTAAEAAEKLGISLQAFSSLCCANTSFASLDFESQQKYIANLTPEKQKEIFALDKSQSVAKENVADEKQKTPEEILHQAIHESKAKDKRLHEVLDDKKSFIRMNHSEKVKAYSEEAAMNNFLYGDKNRQRTIEEWEALPKKERKELAKQIEQDTINKGTKNTGFFKRKDSKILLDEMMTRVKTANTNGIALKDFEQLPETDQRELVYNFLKTVKEVDEQKGFNTLTPSEKYRLEQETLLLDSVNYVAAKNTNKKYNLCPSEADQYLKNNNLTKVEAEYIFLQDKKTRGEKLSNDEKTKLENCSAFLNSKAGKVLKNKVGIKSEVPKLITEISNSSYAEAFDGAKTGAEKAIVLKSYIQKTYGKNENYGQIVEDYMNDAAENGEIDLAFGLHSMARSDRKISQTFSESANSLTQGQNSMNMRNMGDKAATAVKTMEANENDNESRIFMQTALDTCPSQEMPEVMEVTTGSRHIEVQTHTVDVAIKSKDSKIQDIAYKLNAEKSSEVARLYAVDKIGEVKADVQLKAVDYQIADHNEKIVEKMSTKTSALAKENQKPAFSKMKNLEQYFSDDFNKKVQSNLADDIQNCHKDNQLDMHKEIMTSKYQEVQERASGNIHKYDESVQSNALKVTYASGNEKAIQAAESHIQEYAPKVQTEIMNAKVIEAAYKEAQANDEAKISLSGSLSIAEISKLSPAEKQEYYKQAFSKASPAEKIAMLTKLPGTQQKSVYTIICRFCPELLVGMVEGGQAKKMLNSGLPVDAVNKIFNIMERSTKIEVINQLKELKGDNAFKAYFTKDSAVEKAVNQESPSSQGFNFFTNAFATPPRIASTEVKIYEKQQKKSMDIRI